MTVKSIPREQAEKYGVGMCVAMIEDNGYHDSYFKGIFAVPDGTGGYNFVTETTGATAYAGGFVAVEDATDEVMVAYRDKRNAVLAGLATERAEREARKPDTGKDVVFVEAITRGKNKTAAGTTGRVDRREVNAYDSRWSIASGHRTYRLRIVLDTEDRVVWADESKVRVAGFEAEDLPISMDNVDYIIAAMWPHR